LAPSDDKADAIIVVAIAVFGGRSLMFWHVPLERDHLVDSMMSVIGIFRQLTNQGKGNKIASTFQVRCLWPDNRRLERGGTCSILGNALSQSLFLLSSSLQGCCSVGQEETNNE
jgi:hypothetical protein